MSTYFEAMSCLHSLSNRMLLNKLCELFFLNLPPYLESFHQVILSCVI